MTNGIQRSPLAQSSGLPWSHAALALAVVIVWGTNFVVTRIALDHLPPLLFATLRFTLVLVPAAFFIRKPDVPWRSLAGYGVLIGFGQFGLLYIAMNGHISPGIASVVLQAQVFFTIGLAMRLSGERVLPYQILALVLGATGIGIIFVHADGDTTPWGLVLALLAAMSWAGGNHVAKASGVTNMLGFVVWASLFSIPPLAVSSLLIEGPQAIGSGIARADIWTWLAVVWQSVGNTLFGYVAWGWLLARHPAATVTPTALLIPVVGMASSAWWLHEPLPAWKILAAAFVIGGLGINVLWPLASRLPGFPWRRGAGS